MRRTRRFVPTYFAGAVGGGSDPNFANVALLLHFDGTNGQTTTVDSSTAANTVALASGATLSTTQAKFGGSSLHPNSGACHVTANGTALNLGTGAWTLEFWIYPVTLASEEVVMWAATGSGAAAFIYTLDGGGSIRIQGWSSTTKQYDFTSDAALNMNAWNFVQVRRTKGTSDLIDWAVNGTTQSTSNLAMVTGTAFANITNWYIGNYSGLSEPVQGYIDDLRLTTVTRPFAVPSAAFPDS